MDSLAKFAELTPDRIAAQLSDNTKTISYAQLHERTARLSVYLAASLDQGEVIAILLGNRLEYFEAAFGARRAGLYYVPISAHSSSSEIEQLIEDSGARILITESSFEKALMAASSLSSIELTLFVDREAERGEVDYESIVGNGTVPVLPGRALGLDFAYSSGTTGRPKGIRHRMQGDDQLRKSLAGDWLSFFPFDAQTVYLSPAPMYHAAPLRFSIRCIASGGTVITMPRFDPEAALAAIQRYGVTHSQWVPTMLVRLLALPKEIRDSFDLSTHRYALHAAAPCPIDVKRKIIEWWGSIVWEYYTGSERIGATAISSEEWLDHPGSVGKARFGVLHVLDEHGDECAVNTDGVIFFEGGPAFSYHNDLAKTQSAHSVQGWATYGDIGHVDTDGYLYLTDRLANMIISGGVNIYPQESENVLLQHPLVHDVAVVGIPNSDFGEEVKAVVQLKDLRHASEELAQELIEFCRARVSHIKCPRSVDFADTLPRTETGKLLKRVIRDRYRQLHEPDAK